MHEYSTMVQIVETLLNEIKTRNINSISEVYLEIGELTFLRKEQLIFAYDILTKNTILNKSMLIITEKKAKIKCKSCGHIGKIKYLDDERYHFSMPVFTCPECNNEIDIIDGKECNITKIVCDVEVD